jgi:hypothetical protein
MTQHKVTNRFEEVGGGFVWVHYGWNYVPCNLAQGGQAEVPASEGLYNYGGENHQ